MNVSRRLCAILAFELDTVNVLPVDPLRRCSGDSPLLMHACAAIKHDRNSATLCNTVDRWQVAG